MIVGGKQYDYKKDYGTEGYIIINLTSIEFDKNNNSTILIGKLIDEKDCEEFREYKEVCLIMNENVEVINNEQRNND